MICGKYSSSKELLQDIDREIESLGSAKIKYQWQEIREMTTRILDETGKFGVAKKFFIDTVDLNSDVLIVDGVLAIYEAFKIQRAKILKMHKNRRKIQSFREQNEIMSGLEKLYNETMIH